MGRARQQGWSQPASPKAGTICPHTNRRASKTINGTHTSLLNDGEDLVSEITSGTAVNTLQSPFTDEPIARGGLYFTPNHLGSTTTLTDGSGNLAEQYFYQPFGQTWQSAGTTNPFQFTGRENDGTGLYFYRHRYYSPDLGRFVSSDPLLPVSGPNGYEYAQDDPVDAADSEGLLGVFVSINPKTGLGSAVVVANAGDVIPPGFNAQGSPSSSAVARGGELLLGPFNVSNIPVTGHTPFPKGTFEITGIHVPPNRASEGPGFIYIGRATDAPRRSGKGLHGTGIRPSWKHPTQGCLRCSDDDISKLIYLLQVNRVPVSSRPSYRANTGDTVTIQGVRGARAARP